MIYVGPHAAGRNSRDLKADSNCSTSQISLSFLKYFMSVSVFLLSFDN